MLKHPATSSTRGFDWIDISNPTAEELSSIAEKYNLHPALVKDCLQPGHLPKYEEMEEYRFIIFRIHTERDVIEADSVQVLTNKIAIFYSENFIITIHSTEKEFLEYINSMVESGKLDSTSKVLNALIFYALETYEVPSQKITKALDYYEQTIFLRNKKASLLKGLYYIKRKVDLIRNMLLLSKDIINNIDRTDISNANTRNTRDTYIRIQTTFDTLSDNINHLLNIYFSVSSQRTNEIMRVLTVFSVFFMPLTFIVGIYGMNFEFMPELTWRAGYPASFGLMALVTLIIYLWFRRKGWL